jgi:hypothetical protein
MGLCTAQVAHGACFDWPRNDGIRQPEVEITIEIVTLGVEPPLEARQSGCSSPAYILVYDKGIRGTSKSSQLAVIAGYVIDHSRDRVFAKVNGRAGVLRYPVSFHKPPAATFFVSHVSSMWSVPKRR